MPVSFQRCRLSQADFLYRQRESVTDTGEKGIENHQYQPGWPEQAGCSEFWMTWIGERLNSTKQPRPSDPRPISATGSILAKAKGGDEPEKPGARDKRKSRRGSIRVLVRQTISASFCEVWGPSPPDTARLGLLTLQGLLQSMDLTFLQQTCTEMEYCCLFAVRRSISRSLASQHFRHGQQLWLLAVAECPCVPADWHPAPHLYIHPSSDDLCKQHCWERKMLWVQFS